MCAQRGRSSVAVLDVYVVEAQPTAHTQADRILAAARECRNFDALIVHADADRLTLAEARAQRFEPGYQLVRQALASGEDVCAQLVPLIPVRTVEAWMLADLGSLLVELGVAVWSSEHRQIAARRVETLSDPKGVLRQIARSARPQTARGRSVPLSDLYDSLGRRGNLRPLLALESFQHFVADLADVLAACGIL